MITKSSNSSSSITSQTGYKELSDSSSSSSNTVIGLSSAISMAANNSPLLKRLQLTRIKHLLSVKSKITPMCKEMNMEPVELLSDAADIDLDFENEPSVIKSLPNSPIRNRQSPNHKDALHNPLSTPQPTRSQKHNNNNHISTDKLFNSEQNSKFRLSDPNISRRIRQRVKSVLTMPKYTNSGKNSENKLDEKKSYSSEKQLDCLVTPQKNTEKQHVHIVNHSNSTDNVIPLETPYLPNNQNESGTWPISYHPIDEIRDVILLRDSTKRFGIKLDRTTCGEQITYIVMILPGSVAQKSGLKVGDQIVRVDHFYVHQISMESLVEYIRSKKESVRVFFKARSLLVRAKVVQIKKEDNKFGLRLIRRVQGVFVDYVIPDSAADKASLKEGDQLLKINNIDVSHWSQEKATQLLKNSSTQNLTLHVYDATFAANDCLHKKNIFFDCNDSTPINETQNNSDSMIGEYEFDDADWTMDSPTFSWPNTPQNFA